MVNVRRGLPPLVLLAALAACRQEVPLPAVTAMVDGSARDSRARPPIDESDAAPVDGGEPDLGSDAGSCNGGVRQVYARQYNSKVVLVIDRSASMSDKPAGATISRWQMVQNVLRPLMRTYHLAIFFGYAEFPAAGECSHMGCCAGGFLPPGPNADAIETRWSCGQSPCPVRAADSPLGPALYGTRRRLEGASETTGERHVLVVTDGEPSCAGVTSGAACDEATKEVAGLVGQDIPTTVIALDPALKSSSCLNDLAAVGRQGGRLQQSADEASLRAQLEAFLAPLSAEACTFRLNEALEAPERLALRLDDTSVRRDPSRIDGWDFDNADDMARFTVYGSWCDKLRRSEGHKIDVDAFVCSR